MSEDAREPRMIRVTFQIALSKNLTMLLSLLEAPTGFTRCFARYRTARRGVQVAVSSNVRALRRPGGSAASAGRRFRANWPAELRGAGVRVPCTVIDISSVGACLRLEEPPPTNETLRLIIANVPPIPATSAWRKNAFVGLRFAEEQKWVLETQSKRFDPAAWIKD